MVSVVASSWPIEQLRAMEDVIVFQSLRQLIAIGIYVYGPITHQGTKILNLS
jgi:hypothetical protein